MREIILTQGYKCQVDDEDYKKLSEYKWYYHGGYAVRNHYNNGIQRTVIMHRTIMKVLLPKEEIDHIDHNGLNNQKNNLRVGTHRQNIINRPTTSKFTIYKGLRFSTNVKKPWQARIVIENGVRMSLGYFKEEVDAAKAYDKAAKEHFGEFAHLNFPSV